jgi:multidrug transporter EmrE-like cation transporter
VFTLSIAVLIPSIAVLTLSIAVLTLSTAYIVPEGYADIIVLVIVVTIFSSVVDR